jgi:hypothetical protein
MTDTTDRLYGPEWGFSLACFGVLVVCLDVLYSAVYKRPFLWTAAAPTRLLYKLNEQRWETPPRRRITAGFQSTDCYTRPRLYSLLCSVAMLLAYAPGAVGAPSVGFSGFSDDAGVWIAFIAPACLVVLRALDFTRSLRPLRATITLFMILPFSVTTLTVVQIHGSIDAALAIIIVSILLTFVFSLILLAKLVVENSQDLLRDLVAHQEEADEDEIATAVSLLLSSADRSTGKWYLGYLPGVFCASTILPLLLLVARRQAPTWSPAGDVMIALLLFFVGPVFQYVIDSVFFPAAIQTERRFFRFLRDTRPGAIQFLRDNFTDSMPALEPHLALVSRDSLMSPTQPDTRRFVARQIGQAAAFHEARRHIEAPWDVVPELDSTHA